MRPLPLARSVIVGLALVLASLLAAGLPVMPVAAQSSCDPAYPDFCIPPEDEVGDLNCSDINATNFTVLDPDPHGFDTDLDGVGCESSTPQGSSSSEGIAAENCDPSYPDAC